MLVLTVVLTAVVALALGRPRPKWRAAVYGSVILAGRLACGWPPGVCPCVPTIARADCRV